MTNFDRATRRMQAQGLRPWQPDHDTGASPRCLHRPAHDFHSEDSAREAGRIDFIIVAFAAGVALGMLIGG